MALFFALRGRLFIVLDEENVERIQRNDPFEVDTHKLAEPLTIGLPLQIAVCYATKAEQEKISSMTIDELRAYLFRGFAITQSDIERGEVYGSLLRKGKEPL